MFFNSLKHAVRGIKTTFVCERNYRFMFVCFIIIIPVSFLIRLSPLEWAAILLCCGGVISLEMVNSAIESAVDLTTAEFQPLAKKAKDIAAGAVLVFSIFAAVIGLIIIIPRIIHLISAMVNAS